MSNLNVIKLDPPMHLHQFDANSGKIQYVCDPKTLLWSKSTFYHKGYKKYKLFDLTKFIPVLPVLNDTTAIIKDDDV